MTQKTGQAQLLANELTKLDLTPFRVPLALSVPNACKSNIPKEVGEQIGISAGNLANRLFGESIAACGTDDSPERVMTTLVEKVLDWVAENRRGK